MIATLSSIRRKNIRGTAPPVEKSTDSSWQAIDMCTAMASFYKEQRNLGVVKFETLDAPKSRELS